VTQIIPVRPDHADAVALILELDAVLTLDYPPESRHGFSVDKLVRENVHFFVTYVDERPAGCGGVLLVEASHAEIKRMYVRDAFRGSGLGRLMLAHLEAFTRAQHITRLRLETGIYQTAALRLYEQMGFKRIAPFGPYWNDPVSICMEKVLEPLT
jgi:GNAT superfamily N-acetyltransferase